MKIFRYIFIIVVIGLIIFAAYTLNQQNTITEEQENSETVAIEKQSITTLRLGTSRFDSMNPLLSGNRAIQYIDKLIFEPLLTINEDFSLSNCLAKEYSKTGDNSYLIKLREDVKWHDGMPLEARDVQFTIDRLKDTENPINSIYKENVKNIQQVDIIDDHTVKIILDRQIPFFEYNLIFPILPYHYYIDENFKDSTKIPIGTGMYKITAIEYTYIGINKNENWWNTEKKAKIDEININLYSSMGEVYNAFKIGNIDMVPTTNVNYNQYIGTIGYNVKDYPAREYDFLALNTKNTVLQKKEVRQAIAKAIDKNNIVATIYNNTYSKSDYPLDYGHYLYDDTVSKNEYDTEQAKKLLEDNGWTLSYSNNWTKYENYRTYRTAFTLLVNSSNVKRVAVAESIKNQLEEIGIGITIRAVSDEQYNNYIANRNYDLLLTGTYISASPNLETFFGQNNLANYTNEKVNNIMTALYSINDKKILKESYKQLQEIYQDEVPYISLYRNREYLIYSIGLIGELKPNWFDIYYNMENWYRQN